MSVSFKQLTEYLTECLNQESLSNLHFELLHKNYEGKYIPGDKLPFCFLDNPIDFNGWKYQEDPSVSRIVELGKQETENDKSTKYVKNTYVIGYPVFRFNNKISENNWKTNVHPVFYWIVTKDETWHISGKGYLNSEFLRRLDGDALTAILEEFDRQGLSREYLKVDFQKVADILGEFWYSSNPRGSQRYEYEEINPKKLKTPTLFKKKQKQGLLNCMIFGAVENNDNYTRGLRLELSRIVEKDNFHGTALATVLDAVFNHEFPKLQKKDQDTCLIETKPLNKDQKEAVLSALERPITIIQGPPGTGKSNVVKHILFNAFNKGQRVLFASKNDKALEAVAGQNDIEEIETAKRKEVSEPEKLYLMFPKSDKDTVFFEYRNKWNDLKKFNYQGTIDRQKTLLDDIKKIHQDILNEEEKIRAIEEHSRALVQDSEAFKAYDTRFPKAKEPDLDMLVAAAAKVNGCYVDALNKYESILHPKTILARIIRLLFLKNYRAQASEFVLDMQEMLDRLGTKGRAIEFWKENPEDAVFEAQRIQKLVEDPRALAFWKNYKALKQYKPYFVYDKRIYDLKQKLQEKSEQWEKVLPGVIRERGLKLVPSIDHDLTAVSKVEGGRMTEAQKRVLKNCLTVYPLMAAKALSLNGRLPLEPGIFDLLVIDEAGQVDPASVIPLLYRAKRVVIIGDTQQLPSIINLEKSLHNQIQWNNLFRDTWAYIGKNSILTIMQGADLPAECRFMLRDHYRCNPQITQFVSGGYYGGHLNDRTDIAALKKAYEDEAGIVWFEIDNSAPVDYQRYPVNVCPEEVKKVVKLVENNVHKGLSIGVVTPFANQKDEIIQQLKIKEIENIECATAHGFQGGEKDIIIYSLAVPYNIRPGIKQFLEDQDNLFNVALTRAKSQLLVVGDKKAVQESGIARLIQFMGYVETCGKQYSELKRVQDQELIPIGGSVSALETRLADYLQNTLGYEIHQQHPVGRYKLDIAIWDPERANSVKLDIEVDGVTYHATKQGELRYSDVFRNEYLIKNGWDVLRFWSFELEESWDTCVQKIVDWVENKEIHFGQEKEVVEESNQE